MIKWTTSFYESNRIKLHYLRTGGDKPPVILLHGLISSGACWILLARELANDYDVIMPDARGHGRSSTLSQSYSYEMLAIDVLNLIKVLNLTSIVLVGHSMGGMTAALIASLMPYQLRGLVLVDPTFLTPQRQREVYESDVATQHRHILARSREELLADLRMRHRCRSAELIELLVQARFQTSIHAFKILTPPNPDYRQLIHRIATPSLLVIGGVNGVVSPEIAAELANLNHRLKVIQIPEAGHGIPYDQPEHFANIVKAFLRSVNC